MENTTSRLIKTVLMTRDIRRDSKVAVLGSNYPMFDKRTDPECPKCAAGIELKEPRDIDRFTFKMSLDFRAALKDSGIDSRLIFLPSDLIKGATPYEIRELRATYLAPASLAKLLVDAGITPKFVRLLDPKTKQQALHNKLDPDTVLFALESEFRRRALTFYTNIMTKGKINGTSVVETERDERIIVEAKGIGPYERIPIASKTIEGYGPPTVFCQLILTRILKRLEEMGFTHLIGIFDDRERICASQGCAIAEATGLNLSITMIFLGQNPDSTFKVSGLYRSQNAEE
ncbi:hypothetical protein HY990_06160 [Candidatus Micrarchaeota archaeon]|nr:hypothetical protein [Candidatus Micrarchaeota archaeon]